MPSNPTKPNHIYLIYIYKEDLVLNNLQGLIFHKTQPTNQPTNQPTIMKLSAFPFVLRLLGKGMNRPPLQQQVKSCLD